MIEFMLVVSTETNRPDVIEDSQKDALAEMDLLNNLDSISSDTFEVVKDVASQKAQEQRDKIIGFLGSEVVDGFKTRMCVNFEVTESEKDYSGGDSRLP